MNYLRARSPAVSFIEGLEPRPLVSAITVAELYAGARNARERGALDEFLEAFEVVPVGVSEAKLGGELRRKYGQSHGTGLADALIAATAQLRGATLMSFNRKHFPMVHDFRVPYRRK